MHIPADAWYSAFHEAQMACAPVQPAADVLAVLADLRTAVRAWVLEQSEENAAALCVAVEACGGLPTTPDPEATCP